MLQAVLGERQEVTFHNYYRAKRGENIGRFLAGASEAALDQVCFSASLPKLTQNAVRLLSIVP